jgi:hypothetical protein
MHKHAVPRLVWAPQKLSFLTQLPLNLLDRNINRDAKPEGTVSA